MKAPKMTAEEARSFDQVSIGNAMMVDLLLKKKCDCHAYEDVFTYNRWRAQGYQVQRGEKSIKLPLVKVVTEENEDTGEPVECRRILGSSAVFCRCQVQPINES